MLVYSYRVWTGVSVWRDHPLDTKNLYKNLRIFFRCGQPDRSDILGWRSWHGVVRWAGQRSPRVTNLPRVGGLKILSNREGVHWTAAPQKERRESDFHVVQWNCISLWSGCFCLDSSILILLFRMAQSGKPFLRRKHMAECQCHIKQKRI